jgi:hypothetical protein
MYHRNEYETTCDWKKMTNSIWTGLWILGRHDLIDLCHKVETGQIHTGTVFFKPEDPEIDNAIEVFCHEYGIKARPRKPALFQW